MGGCTEIGCVYLGMSGTFVIALQRKVLCKTKDFQLIQGTGSFGTTLQKKKKERKAFYYLYL